MTVEILQLSNGREPFKDWMETLSKDYQAKVLVYVKRVDHGGSKTSVKSVGDGVWEIKLKVPSGLRVYFAIPRKGMMLLLLGGDKSTQSKDINKAKHYWRDYV